MEIVASYLNPWPNASDGAKAISYQLSGMNRVLQVGCADAFGTRVLCQEVKALTATDFDPVFVEDVNRRMDPDWPFEFFTHDMLSGPVIGPFDGACAVDAIEHIHAEDEDRFVGNMFKSLGPHGVCIHGSPSLESQTYASPGSKAGHVNCKSGDEFRQLMARYFHNVFLFSMNDEVVHTGYHKMAHYLFAIGSDRRA